jgi:hypothetical protein
MFCVIPCDDLDQWCAFARFDRVFDEISDHPRQLGAIRDDSGLGLKVENDLSGRTTNLLEVGSC